MKKILSFALIGLLVLLMATVLYFGLVGLITVGVWLTEELWLGLIIGLLKFFLLIAIIIVGALAELGLLAVILHIKDEWL